MEIDIEKFEKFMEDKPIYENALKVIEGLQSDLKYRRGMEELKDEMIQLMLQDLIKGCYYEDDAAQICEIKHTECTQYKDVECRMCLFKYYLDKAEEVLQNENSGIN